MKGIHRPAKLVLVKKSEMALVIARICKVNTFIALAPVLHIKARTL